MKASGPAKSVKLAIQEIKKTEEMALIKSKQRAITMGISVQKIKLK